MDIEQMREELKSAGNKQATNMKDETVIKKHGEMGAQKINNMNDFEMKEELNHVGSDLPLGTSKTVMKKALKSLEDVRAPDYVNIESRDVHYLKSIDFDYEWLASIANQYDFDRFQYMHKFRAFRCYRGNNQIDWISINNFEMIHKKKKLTQTLLKHQPLQKDKQVIKLPWRQI